MLLNHKQLLGLPVRTKAGVSLGKLSDFELDADTGKISKFHVQIPGVLPHLLHQEAFVDWGQVVCIDDKEVVVVDTFVLGEAAVPSGIIPPPVQP